MPDNLGETGRAIWDAFEASKRDAFQQALIREIARCADTLDTLDALILGRRPIWAELIFDDMGQVNLFIDKALDQRRNYELTLRALFAEARAAGLKPAGVKASGVDEEPEDMLARMRKAKSDRERQHG